MTVKQVQLLLAYLGYDPGELDGIWGKKTSAALACFQSDYGIQADGFPGDKTYMALRNAVCYGMTERESDDAQHNSQNSSTQIDDSWPYPHFSWAEMKCKCSDPNCIGKTTRPEAAIMEGLEKVREHFGRPVTISSGYRCPAHNAAVGGVSNSYHTKGRAADITVQGVSGADVLAYCQMLGPHYTYAIDSSYVHMDF